MVKEYLTLTTTVTVRFDDQSTVAYVQRVKAALQNAFQSVVVARDDNDEYRSISIAHDVQFKRWPE